MNQVSRKCVQTCARSNSSDASSATQRSAMSSRRSTSPAPAAWGRSRCWASSARANPGCGPRRKSAASQAPPTARVRRISRHRPDSLGPGFLHRGLPGKVDSKPRCTADRGGYARGSRRRPPVATVEHRSPEQQRETAACTRNGRPNPKTESSGRTEKEPRSPPKDAGLIADQKLEDSAGKALKGARQDEHYAAYAIPQGSHREKSRRRQRPLPSPEAAKLIDASAEAIDAELLGLSGEESTRCCNDPRTPRYGARTARQQEDAYDDPPRFHTLKGSGRMVGLMRLGKPPGLSSRP